MDAEIKRATVHDVAAAAGVSLATVDRVLNNRPGVTNRTTRLVQDAVQRIGYQRDDTAARLATRRRTPVLFVLPDPGTNGFMAELRREIDREADRLRAERVFITVVQHGSLDDAASLARVLDGIGPDMFDGVVAVAIDHPLVDRAIAAAVARGCLVLTLVSDAPRSARSAYVGIDNEAAGRVAATLLGRFTGPGPATIGLILGSHALRDHAERAHGIRDELASRFPRATLLPAIEGRDDRDTTRRQALALLGAHPDLAGIYNAGAGNRGLLAALAESGRAGAVAVVAHELTEHAREALRDGRFSAILHQDGADEVARALALIRARHDGVAARPPRPTRIEIFLEHNIPRPLAGAARTPAP